MSGLIRFSDDDDWAENSSRTRFVFDFLLDRLPDGAEKNDIQERQDHNVLLLDLRQPSARNVVDVIAEQLQNYVDEMPDGSSREAFRPQMMDLVALARAKQQEYRE